LGIRDRDQLRALEGDLTRSRAARLAHSRHDIVDRWVCVVAASTSFPGVL
jgi:hypothetical protein